MFSGGSGVDRGPDSPRHLCRGVACLTSLALGCSSSSSASTPNTVITPEVRRACGALRTLVADVAQKQDVFSAEVEADATELRAAANETSNAALIAAAHDAYETLNSITTGLDTSAEKYEEEKVRFSANVADASDACMKLGMDTPFLDSDFQELTLAPSTVP